MATVQGLWIGPALGAIEVLCIRSFLARGHAFDLYLYGETRGVPRGCTVRDARTILGEDRIFYYQHEPGRGSPAAFANVFRYKLLHERGGWWVDLDVLCLTDALPGGQVSLARENETMVNNAILKFPAGHPAMAYAYAAAVNAGTDVKWGQTGPSLLTRVVMEFGLEPCLAPQRDFYPIGWSDFDAVLHPTRRDYVLEQIRGASFLHLWNEMYRRANCDKRVRPPRGSYLYGMFADHGMLNDFRAEYIATETKSGVAMDIVPLRRRAIFGPAKRP